MSAPRFPLGSPGSALDVRNVDADSTARRDRLAGEWINHSSPAVADHASANPESRLDDARCLSKSQISPHSPFLSEHPMALLNETAHRRQLESGGHGARITVARDASLVHLEKRHPARTSAKPRGRGKRKKIDRFTKRSQSLLRRQLNQTRLDAPAWFLTLTFPDSEKLSGREYKRHFENFTKRLKRQFPTAAGFYVFENQTRKSGASRGITKPHVHILLWNVPRTLRIKKAKLRHGKLEKCQNGGWKLELRGCHGARPGATHVERWQSLTPARWISVQWYDTVGSRDLRHFRAGARCSRVRSARKTRNYLSKGNGEEPQALPEGFGRYWGKIDAKSIPKGDTVEIPCTLREYAAIARVGRKFFKSVTGRRGRWDHWSVWLICDANQMFRWISTVVSFDLNAATGFA